MLFQRSRSIHNGILPENIGTGPSIWEIDSFKIWNWFVKAVYFLFLSARDVQINPGYNYADDIAFFADYYDEMQTMLNNVSATLVIIELRINVNDVFSS